MAPKKPASIARPIEAFFGRTSGLPIPVAAPPVVTDVSSASDIIGLRNNERDLPRHPSAASEASFCDGLTLAKTFMHPTWYSALEPEFEKPYFLKLFSFLDKRQKAGDVIYPPPNMVFSWAQNPLPDIKVVLLGQDPYHNPGQAHGLSFSVLPGVPPPPSLVNIYKELATDIGSCPEKNTCPFHGEQKLQQFGKKNGSEESYPSRHGGTLTGWAEQGVLLLNAVLTVEKNKPASHAGVGWEQFTDAVLKAVNSRRDAKPVAYILWGSHAQKKIAGIGKNSGMSNSADKNVEGRVVKSVHPSPLSAHRGFFGSRPFSKVNSILETAGWKGIDWTHVSCPHVNDEILGN